VRVFNSATAGATPADYINAISECAQPARRVRVITVSIASNGAGAYELSKLEDRIIDAQRFGNINVVASAGNNSDYSAVAYPARFPAAFAVGASDPAGVFCWFSNRGTGLDISSLGCNLEASAFDGSVGWFAGTSYSAPTVSGIVAALRSYRSDLSATQTEQLLLDTAKRTSAGRVIDATAAFRAAGMGHLVDAYRPPAYPRPGGASNDVNGVTDDAIAGDRPAKPRLRSASFRRGVIRVRVATPPPGADAIFRINGKSYLRAKGTLRLRVRSWRSVSVLIEDKWGVRSEPLKIRRPRRR
jgi:subtilisin family serine protease